MIGQEYPYVFPYSFLDYGLALLALVLIGVLGYLFVTMAKTQHKAANESWAHILDVLERLAQTTNTLAERVEDTQNTVERTREEVWRNRELISRGLDQAAAALSIGTRLESGEERLEAAMTQAKDRDHEARERERDRDIREKERDQRERVRDIEAGRPEIKQQGEQEGGDESVDPKRPRRR